MRSSANHRLIRMAFGFGVVMAAHFAPLSLTREQRERVLIALTGRDRSEVAWVEGVRDRRGIRTTDADSRLWVTVLPTVDELRRRGSFPAGPSVPWRGAWSGRLPK